MTEFLLVLRWQIQELNEEQSEDIFNTMQNCGFFKKYLNFFIRIIDFSIKKRCIFQGILSSRTNWNSFTQVSVGVLVYFSNCLSR